MDVVIRTDADLNALLPKPTAAKFEFKEHPHTGSNKFAVGGKNFDVATLTPQQAQWIVQKGYRYLVPKAKATAKTAPKNASK